MSELAMTVQNPAQPAFAEPTDIQLIWRSGLAWLLILTLFSLSALLVDTRELEGVNVWAKPFKFSVSTTLHFATMLLCLRLVSRGLQHTFWMRTATWAAAVALVFEMSYIFVQAAQAEHSHFNADTNFHRVMYGLMGIGAVTLIAVSAVIGLAAWFSREIPAALRHGIATGLVGGFLVTLIVAGYLGGNGSHFVGAPAADAPTLPLFGWSRTVGDLRPAHFLALHMMQFVPLAGLVLARIAPARGVVSVWAFALAYVALTMGVFVQARMGLPLIPA